MQHQQRVYNFSAGPAAMPVEVLEQIQREMLNFEGTGASVMEISHRSPAFAGVIERAERDLRELLGVPEGYSVLFMQGGAWTQFACVPLNLLGGRPRADYLVTGGWSASAAREARRYCDARVVASSEEADEPGVWRGVPPRDAWKCDPEAAYLYYCANETVMGVQLHDVPEAPAGVPLVADVSSCFLAAPLDVSRFGLVLAGAQKNVGPAGLTVVIVRDSLLDAREPPESCPTMLRYAVMRAKRSMHNTPPTFAVYAAGLVFRHLLERGGLAAAAERNRAKAEALYAAVDENPAYLPHVSRAEDRSVMNVVFRVAGADGRPDAEAEAEFLRGAEERGLVGLKGHRSIGGLRASIYNAMPLEGVLALVAYLREFRPLAIA